MTKYQIEREYQQAALNYKIARTKNEKEKALDEMAYLEKIASWEHGFQYSDWLHESEWKEKNI